MRSVSILVVIVMVLLVAGMAMAGTPYATSSTGNLLSGWLSSGDGGLQGTGAWINQVGSQYANIVWNIQQEGNAYHYHYDVSVRVGAFSHIILGVSDSFKSSEIWGVTVGGQAWPTSETVIGTFSSSQGSMNPNMPAPLYGVAFTNVSGLLGSGATSTSIDFYSSRVPTWRNFYAKDGNAGQLGQNSMWNGAFGGGNAAFMVAAPDTKSVVPEPSTVTGLLAGLFGLGGMLLRRRK